MPALTMRLPNSYAPMTNGMVAATAPNQISQPTSTGPGVKCDKSTGPTGGSSSTPTLVVAAAAAVAAQLGGAVTTPAMQHHE